MLLLLLLLVSCHLYMRERTICKSTEEVAMPMAKIVLCFVFFLLENKKGKSKFDFCYCIAFCILEIG